MDSHNYSLASFLNRVFSSNIFKGTGEVVFISLTKNLKLPLHLKLTAVDFRGSTRDCGESHTNLSKFQYRFSKSSL